MMNGATVTLAGYVANEPVYKTINDMTPKVYLRVAWTSRYLDRVTGEWRDGKTSFASVHCWRKLASNVAPSLRKGEAVVVTGRLQIREYEDKDGQRRVSAEIEADAIGHDLSRGVTHFQRTTRPSGDDMGRGRTDSLPKDEDPGDGFSSGGLTSADSLDQAHDGHGPVSSTDAGELFDQDAVDALAAAEPATAGAPF